MFTKHFLAKSSAAMALVIGSLSASAQEVAVDDVSVAAGAVAAVNVTYTAPGGSDVVLIQLDINFDEASLGAPDLSSCSGAAPNGGSTFCSTPSPGSVRIINEDAFLNPLGSGVIGTISWDTSSVPAPVASYPLTVSGLLYSDSGAQAVNGTSVDGSITLSITGSAGYGSNPAPGATIDLGVAVVGQSVDSVTDDIVVSEIGDQQLDVTAIAFSGANAADFGSSTAPFNIPDGDPDVDVDLNCTPSARGDRTATVELTNNSSNNGTPQYTLECVGLSPNVQVPAGPINLMGLTVDPDPTANITVTNPQDGFASDAANVTAVAGAGDAEITVTTAGPAAIAVDGSFDFVVSCDSSAPGGSFSRTIDFTWDNPDAAEPDSASVVVNCDITDEVASYDSVPAPGSTIDLGTTTNGVTSAPQTIDVENDGVGSTTASDLTITGATTSDPQFAVTFDGTAIAVGNTLADAIEVTCTPDPGTNGLITATLSVTHDGDTNPASPVEYDLECTGEPDGAFDSSPAPGGVLNLGVVPPATTTPIGSIDFSNNGAADDIDVACTFAGPAEIEFLSDPFNETIAAGGSASAEFQCTPSTPATFQGTLTCNVTGDDNFQDPVEYTVLCQGQPLVIPTMNQWGLIIMSLMLLMVAGLVGRRWFANQD
ncbi:MAG: IPTL-CTERM sorting domain-containing protein [Pseudomonadota bacterium]